jgi:hypothetical protein
LSLLRACRMRGRNTPHLTSPLNEGRGIEAALQD